MMLHFHGTPITPQPVLESLAGRNFCVRYGAHGQVETCHRIGQSVMLDNGAFSFWRKNEPTDWPGFYGWVEQWLDHQTTWAVIPDVIDGGEPENDALLAEWPFGDRGAPVWHMHESLERLQRLADEWPRVCVGSSGTYSQPGSYSWTHRMDAAFNALDTPVWVHMLRAMKQACEGPWPFASTDSTNVGRNHNRGGDSLAAKVLRARSKVEEIDAQQSPGRWSVHEQIEMAA